MWNNISLKPPPTNSYYGDYKSVDTTLLKRTLDEFLGKIGQCKDALHLEAALLSRIIYRLKIKFRSDLGMRFMTKINKALHRYLDLEIVNDVRHFLKSVPLSKVGNVYFPTKQMFEYVLVRLQGFSKVMTRIIETAGETAYFMTTRMKLGHFWNVALIVLSLVSRIWEISQHIIEACCKCYSKILPVRKQLQLNGVPWLEEGYEFPQDLRIWLNLKWSAEDLKRITQQHLNLPVYVLSDDEDEDDIQFCFQYKNDCIVIDDDLKITDDDVQFVNEYIDIIEKNNENRKRVRDIISRVDISEDDPVPVIELDSDSSIPKSPINNNQPYIENNNSDIEVIETARLILDDDIGEAVSRKRKRKRKGKSTETEIQEGVMNSLEKRKNLSVIEVESPKRSRMNDTIVTIPDTPSSTSTILRIPDHIQNSPIPESIDDSGSDIFSAKSKTKKSVVNSTPKSTKSQKRDRKGSFSTTLISSIRADSDDISDSNNETLTQNVTNILLKKKKSKKKRKAQTEDSTIELSSVADSEDSVATVKRKSVSRSPKSKNKTNYSINLDEITTIKDIKAFLAKEKNYRDTKNPNRVSVELGKAKWTQLIKSIENIFSSRKVLKQDKKIAVKLAKDLIQFYIKA